MSKILLSVFLIYVSALKAENDSALIVDFLKKGCFVREMSDQIALNNFNESTSYYFRIDTIRPDGYGILSMSERYKSSKVAGMIETREKVFANKEVYRYLFKIIFSEKRIIVFTGDEAYNLKQLIKGNLPAYIRDDSYKLNEGEFLSEYNGFRIDLDKKNLIHDFIKYKESADNFYEYAYVLYYVPYPVNENENRENKAKMFSQRVEKIQQRKESNDEFAGSNPVDMSAHSQGWIYVAEIDRQSGEEITTYTSAIIDAATSKKVSLEKYLKRLKKIEGDSASHIIAPNSTQIVMNINCNLRAEKPMPDKAGYRKGSIIGTIKSGDVFFIRQVEYVPASNGNYYLWMKIVEQ